MTEPRLRAAAGFCGIAGPAALTVYFAAPAVVGWPYAGASPARLSSFATAHQILFFAGAWFQATGTLLCVIFFLAIVHLAGAVTRLSGLILIVASASLLATVLVEAAFLIAVPIAAVHGDTPAVVTAFDLSNGIFVRVFSLGPASASYLALGSVILESGLLACRFGRLAAAIGIAFALAGLIAVFSSIGVVLIIALSVCQEIWIVAAAVTLWRSSRNDLAAAAAGLPVPT